MSPPRAATRAPQRAQAGAATIQTMRLSAGRLAGLLGGRVEGDTSWNRPLTSITADSRAVTPGGVFIALRGDRMDGHAFVAAAATAGAAVAVVDQAWRAPADTAVPPVLIRVLRTSSALRRACRARVSELGVHVVGVTGSVGKTTAKEMIAHVLAGSFRVARTAGNLNTWTGVPLTVLGLDDDPDVLVVEMAMSAQGEIADLARMCPPRTGALLNIGDSHLELLGSRAAIADAKAELLDALPPDGAAVAVVDDPWVRRVIGRSRAPIRRVGRHAPDATWTARDVRSAGLDGSTFMLQGPSGSAPVRLSIPGEHMILTACVAAAVAAEFGIGVRDVAERLADVTPIAGRGVLRRGPRGAVIYDDTYNAAPDSMAAALAVLAGATSTTRVAVLGDMLELGAATVSAHEALGRQAAAAATDLVALGAQAARVVEAAVAAGLSVDRAHIADGPEAAATWVRALCGPDTTVLVKASRGLRLERVVEALGSDAEGQLEDGTGRGPCGMIRVMGRDAS